LAKFNDIDGLAVCPARFVVAPAEYGRKTMLVTVVGTSTPFAYWGFSLVGHVLDAIYGGHRHIHCLGLEHLRAGWSEEKDRPVVVTSDRPDTSLSYLLITSRFPVLAFFDAPRDALAKAVIFDNLALPDAIRFCTQYFSCLAGCSGSDHVQVFGGDWYRASVFDLVASVVAAIGFKPETALIAEAARRAAGEQGLDGDATVEEVMQRRLGGETLSSRAKHRFSPQEQTLVDWFDANYGPILAGREHEMLEWPLDLFSVEKKGDSDAKSVELIGSARHIVWGPYMHLPVGAWRARVQFETIGNHSENEIEGDICTGGKQVFRCNAKLPVRGYYEFNLDFAIADPNAPIEIRVRLLKGAIEGQFGLRRVTLEPIDDSDELAKGSISKQFEALQLSLP
jgi:hypothetical protein